MILTAEQPRHVREYPLLLGNVKQVVCHFDGYYETVAMINITAIPTAIVILKKHLHSSKLKYPESSEYMFGTFFRLIQFVHLDSMCMLRTRRRVEYLRGNCILYTNTNLYRLATYNK
jgi:hypothetical protein